MRKLIVVRAILALLITTLACHGAAAADTLCLKSVLRKGKIKNSTVTVPAGTKCPKGTATLISPETIETTGLQGPPGPQGPKGDQGIQGERGLQGLPGLVSSGITVVPKTSDFTSDNKVMAIDCPAGTYVIGCNGGVIDGLGVLATLPVALSYSTVFLAPTPFCYIRAFETSATSNTWALFGVATCAANG